MMLFLPIAVLSFAVSTTAQQLRSVEADRSLASSTGNLLSNGDAETHICTNDWRAQSPVPGWEVIRGAASVLCYSAFGLANETATLPSSGGTPGLALFGAPGIDTSLTQLVNVQKAAGVIDSGSATVTLSGWLGGWRYRPERAVVTATFLDSAGRAAGSPLVIMGPSQGNMTALFYQSGSGSVPQGTRNILVTLDLPGSHGSYHNSYADNLSLQLQGSGKMKTMLKPAPAAPIPSSTVPQLDHVFLVMMENTNYADIIMLPQTPQGQPTVNPAMPFFTSLVNEGVLLTDMWGTYHPSDQNYVAMVAGNTYKYGPVYFPNYNLNVTHIGDLLEAKGLTWKSYAQSAIGPCDLTDHGFYYPDDEPFVQFTNVIGNASRCNSTILPLSSMFVDAANNNLPNFAWISANDYSDGEAAWFVDYNVTFSIEVQDQFLKMALEPLLNSSTWAETNSIIVIVWDESLGWGWPDNHIASAVVASKPGIIQNGQIIDSHYDGYGVLRTIEEAFQLGGFNRFDQYAKPMNEIFVSNNKGKKGKSSKKSHRNLGKKSHKSKKNKKKPGKSKKPKSTVAATLTGSPSASTAGHTDDTFGMVAAQVSAVQGTTLELFVNGVVSSSAKVVLTMLGSTPSSSSPSFTVTNGVASIPTSGLAVGMYGAWLLQDGNFPMVAPLPVTILPQGAVQQSNPGVEFATVLTPPSGRIFEIRYGGDSIVHYCRPANGAFNSTWIGVFVNGTDLSTVTQATSITGMRTSEPCGYGQVYTAFLKPGPVYQIVMGNVLADGTTDIVGAGQLFTMIPGVPATN